MRKFAVGDIVRIKDTEDIGIIVGEFIGQADMWWVQFEDKDLQGRFWYFKYYLEYLGTEQSLAVETLGEDYFA